MYQVQIALAVLVLVAAAANTLSWLSKTNTPYFQMPRNGIGKWLFAAAVVLPILALLDLLGFTSGNALFLVAGVFFIADAFYSIMCRYRRQQPI